MDVHLRLEKECYEAQMMMIIIIILIIVIYRVYCLFHVSSADLFVVFVRACLQLITDCPPAIQEELDLISALSQLEDFSVRVLPLEGSST